MTSLRCPCDYLSRYHQDIQKNQHTQTPNQQWVIPFVGHSATLISIY